MKFFIILNKIWALLSKIVRILNLIKWIVFFKKKETYVSEKEIQNKIEENIKSQITNPSNKHDSQNVSNQFENKDNQINDQFDKNEEIQNYKNDISSK